MSRTTAKASCYIFCEDSHNKALLLGTLREIPGQQPEFILMMCEDDVGRELCLVPNLQVATEFIRNQRKTGKVVGLYTSAGNSRPKAWSTTVIPKSGLLAKIA